MGVASGRKAVCSSGRPASSAGEMSEMEAEEAKLQGEGAGELERERERDCCEPALEQDERDDEDDEDESNERRADAGDPAPLCARVWPSGVRVSSSRRAAEAAAEWLWAQETAGRPLAADSNWTGGGVGPADALTRVPAPALWRWAGPVCPADAWIESWWRRRSTLR